MRISAFGLVCLASLLLASGPARAQYAAPGFPMLPQGRPRAKEPKKLQSPILPRFWHEADASKLVMGRNKFFGFVSEQMTFPVAARPNPASPAVPTPTGRLFVRILVRPDGSVRQPPLVIKRELARPEGDYPPAAIRALDAEAQRVLGALRFVRSKTLQDSLIVPLRFLVE